MSAEHQRAGTHDRQGRVGGDLVDRDARDQARVDAVLDDFFRLAQRRAESVGYRYVDLWKVLERNTSGGKRFRPRMVFTTYTALGGHDDEAAAKVGAAFELLHTALIVHDAHGRVLVTRRALSKKTWPGVWTNSFCGHPAPGESPEEAVARRASQELGIEVADVTSVLPDFRYLATDASGVVENEICPVFTARAVGVPDPSPDEVAEWAWTDPDALRDAVAATPFAFSPWLGWQLEAWPTPRG